jgi:hypothetical protein
LFATVTGHVPTDYLVPGMGTIAVVVDETPRFGYKAAETTHHILKGEFKEALKSGIDTGVHGQNVAFSLLPFLTEIGRRPPAGGKPAAPEVKSSTPATDVSKQGETHSTPAPKEDTVKPADEAKRADPVEQLMRERAAEAVGLVKELQPLVDRLNKQLFDAVVRKDRAFLERYLTSAEGKTSRVDVLLNATDPKNANIGLARLFYGHALETMLAEAIKNDPKLAAKIAYTANKGTYAGGKKPDFNITSGPLQGWYIDLTTDADAGAHQTKRPYGERQTLHLTYTIGK